MAFPRLSISMDRENIPIENLSPQKIPDEKWKYVDRKGHGHFYSEKNTLPTLEWVVTGRGWVGDEYDGDEYEIGEHRCRLCGETVVPGVRLEYGPKSIPGPLSVTITIGDESFVMDEEGFDRLLKLWLESLRKGESS